MIKDSIDLQPTEMGFVSTGGELVQGRLSGNRTSRCA
jgi:hypothetical protein